MVHRTLSTILQKTFEGFARSPKGFSSTLTLTLVCFQTTITGTYTLPDIGLILEKLMGHGYRSHYTRRRFRTQYITKGTQPYALRKVRDHRGETNVLTRSNTESILVTSTSHYHNPQISGRHFSLSV